MKRALKNKEQECEVTKEMIRSNKLQMKSKDVELQRLKIKIKRLEKTNEIRENMINEIAVNLRTGRDVDVDMLRTTQSGMGMARAAAQLHGEIDIKNEYAENPQFNRKTL